MINAILETSIELWQLNNLCNLQNKFLFIYFSLLSVTTEGGRRDEVKVEKDRYVTVVLLYTSVGSFQSQSHLCS